MNFATKVNLDSGFAFNRAARTKLIAEKKLDSIEWKSEEQARFKPERQTQKLQEVSKELKVQFTDQKQKEIFEHIVLHGSCLIDFQASGQYFYLNCYLWKCLGQSLNSLDGTIQNLVAEIRQNPEKYPFFSLNFSNLYEIDWSQHQTALYELFKDQMRTLEKIKKLTEIKK